MSKNGTLAQRLGFGPSRTTTTPTAQPKPRAPAPRATKQTHPRPRDTSTGLDARQLTPDDYERRLGQLGLSTPGAEHKRLAPPVDAEAQRAARRDLDRAERRAARDHRRAEDARTVELSTGAVDGRNASPADVRARLAQLGVDSTPAAVTVAEVGRGLESRRDTQVDYGARMAQARDVVSEALALCQRTGQRLDTRRLDHWELLAYRRLRGFEPS